METGTINLQPDPRILIAITHNPIRPVDALCELIDNAIDSFNDARAQGLVIESPTIMIDIPRPSDIEKGNGSINILDNGPGLTFAQTEKALRAGFTSRNPFDTLGVFGLGFNISTGKLGSRTIFRTATFQGSAMIEVDIDLEDMVNKQSYNVPFRKLPKDPPQFHGSLIKISNWWPKGNQNYGFASKIARLGISNIREEIGRRYYSLLKEENLRIFIGPDICEPFEHCIWSDHRSVAHRELRQIPAVFRYGSDNIIYSQVRCVKCYSIVDGTICPKCGKTGNLRTVNEIVRGWVGIQRFDDANHYGIDMIRNGRVIRKLEKDAFFTWVDSRGQRTLDYPVDSIYGRIVGEIHIDHVPTDFLKQDFQRTSPEWDRAITFLRGESSLQPKKAEEANEPPNNSPVYRLFQGYRSVRDFGTKDMYMGYWEIGQGKVKRISRDVEQEYYEKFRKKEPGYYDDSEWWKLVEQADSRPAVDVKQCPECAFQCLDTAQICPACGYVFTGKTCINQQCGAKIAISEVHCPVCGTLQIAKPQERWKCAYCSRLNPPASEHCLGCGRPIGEINPLSLDFLMEHSNKDDELSIKAFSMVLPNTEASEAFNVDVYTIEPGISLQREGEALPSLTIKEEGLKIFLDTRHPLFSEFQQYPEIIISMEIAKYIQDANARFMSGEKAHFWSLPSLCWQISRLFWSDRLSVDPERTQKRAREFFDTLREILPEILGEKSSDIYNEMTPHKQGELAQTIVQNGYDAREISKLVEDGRAISFLDNRSIIGLIERYPSHFFDGNFWSDAYNEIPVDDPDSREQIQRLIHLRYRNFLEDIISFLEFKQKDNGYTIRADHTLNLLTRRIVH